MKITTNTLFFAKSKAEAKIPNKIDENAGYDIYPCFEEDFITIPPLHTVLVPTGIHSAMSSDYYAQLQERGSTGSKGIKYGAGVIDSGYRGEWFVPITNCNVDALVITKIPVAEIAKHYGMEESDFIVYPYEKAICQAVILPVPKMRVSEISLDELKAIESQRNEGSLGSSGK